MSYGLVDKNNKIIICGTVSKFCNTYKLQVLCTLKDITVIGGIYKLINYLKQEFNNLTYQIPLSNIDTLMLHNKIKFKILPLQYLMVHPRTLKYFHYKKFKESKLLQSELESLGYLKVFDNGIAEIIL